MGSLMRSIDLSKTPIGPVASWSPALRMMVRFVLANRFPLFLWWGPQYCQLYDDPYRPVLGDKHPRSMSQPATWMEDPSSKVMAAGYGQSRIPTREQLSVSPCR